MMHNLRIFDWKSLWIEFLLLQIQLLDYDLNHSHLHKFHAVLKVQAS